MIDNFFKEEELNPCKEAINLLVDKLADKLYNAGKIKSKCLVVQFCFNWRACVKYGMWGAVKC